MKIVYHYCSTKTGEVVPTLWDVIKTIYRDYKCYHFLNVLWSYSHRGF